MKKVFLTAMIAMALPAWADNYGFLTFETTDGSATSIGAVGTVITFSGGQMTAVADGYMVTLPLSGLSKMYFSNTSEVKLASSDNTVSTITVYTLTGICVGQFNNISEARRSLQQGVYVLKADGRTMKITVK